MKKAKEEVKEEKPHICYICGKEITVRDGEPVYIKTKRGSELFIHTQCVKF